MTKHDDVNKYPNTNHVHVTPRKYCPQKLKIEGQFFLLSEKFCLVRKCKVYHILLRINNSLAYGSQSGKICAW